MTSVDATPPAPPVRRRSWLRRRRRSLIVATVILVLVGVVAYLKAFSPVKVRAHHVAQGEVVQQAFGRGTIESDREAQLGFDLVGRVSEVLVEEGARVALGQELARLQPDQLRADLRPCRRRSSAHARGQRSPACVMRSRAADPACSGSASGRGGRA